MFNLLEDVLGEAYGPEAPPSPVNPYGASKLAVDYALRDEAVAQGRPEKAGERVAHDRRANANDHWLITADEFRAAARQLKGLKKAIEALAESPGGKHVPVQMIGKDFENLSRSILDSAPFAICPHCTGNGLAGDPEHPKKKCGTCKGSGYLDRMQWRVLPDGVKASATVTA